MQHFIHSISRFLHNLSHLNGLGAHFDIIAVYNILYVLNRLKYGMTLVKVSLTTNDLTCMIKK